MNFGEKLQELRKNRKITQEELASILFISRTAVSKWESGRGYPSIESLMAISLFYNISVDDLLFNKEPNTVAIKESKCNKSFIRDLRLGFMDCSFIMFFFLPLFRQGEYYFYNLVPLNSLDNNVWYSKTIFILLVIISLTFGILTLAMQNNFRLGWLKHKFIISILISVLSVIVFIASLQPYLAFISFIFLIIKGILLDIIQ